MQHFVVWWRLSVYLFPVQQDISTLRTAILPTNPLVRSCKTRYSECPRWVCYRIRSRIELSRRSWRFYGGGGPMLQANFEIVKILQDFFWSTSHTNSEGAWTDIEKVTKWSRGMAILFDILQIDRRYTKRSIYARLLKTSKIVKIDRGSNSRPDGGEAVRAMAITWVEHS